MKRKTARAKIAVMMVCLFSVMAFVGCSKVSKENYDKIKIGMSFEDVTEIIGKPDSCDEPVLKTRSCIWESSEKQIKLKFAGDTVAWRSSKGFE